MVGSPNLSGGSEMTPKKCVTWSSVSPRPRQRACTVRLSSRRPVRPTRTARGQARRVRRATAPADAGKAKVGAELGLADTRPGGDNEEAPNGHVGSGNVPGREVRWGGGENLVQRCDADSLRLGLGLRCGRSLRRRLRVGRSWPTQPDRRPDAMARRRTATEPEFLNPGARDRLRAPLGMLELLIRLTCRISGIVAREGVGRLTAAFAAA
jgi:hypothetical protein